MSDVFTNRRPTIDWDEFERRLHRPCSIDQTDDYPLAELLRVIDGKDESHEAHFEPKNPLSAGARPDAGETGKVSQPEAQVRLAGGDFAAIEAGLLGTTQPQPAIVPKAEQSTIEFGRPTARAPLINGDFAAIEAGLLGAAREDAPATGSEADMSDALSSMDIGSQRFLPEDNQPVSRHAGVADGQNRSRRPLYGRVAIAIVAMAGIAASLGLKNRASSPLEIASFRGESEAVKQQMAATSGANVPVPDAAILSKPPEPPLTALDNGTKQSIDLPQVEAKAQPAETDAQVHNTPPAAPSAPAQTAAEPLSKAAPIESAPARTPAEPFSMVAPSESAPARTPAEPFSKAAPIEPAPAQTAAEPLSKAAPIEPEKMKTGAVRTESTLPPSVTPPQANISNAPRPAPRAPAVAKAPRAKAVGGVAKPLKPTAARDPARHGQPRQIATKAKA
ncbi:MAG: hypothetical protein ACRED2_11950, partial [Methylocella sp.]